MSIKKIKSASSNLSVCEICEVGKEIKQSIRDHLQNLCFGEARNRRNRKHTSYASAVKYFLGRYSRFHEKHKTGLIGELLCHIILKRNFSNFSLTSRLFNSEEVGVKKGFDIVLYEKKDNRIWITEVKSSKTPAPTVHAKLSGLLSKGNKDLKKRLDKDSSPLWDNAIAHAEIVVSDTEIKNRVLSILDETYDMEIEDADIPPQSVILGAVFFQDYEKDIQINKIEEVLKKIEEEKYFVNVIAICIHKKVFNQVYNFLKAEAK